MLKSSKVLFLLLLLVNHLPVILFLLHLLLSIVLPANLAEANKRADALALKLEQSEKARKKAESNAAVIEDLRKRLHDAETSLSDNIAQQSTREDEIFTRLESQSRRFFSE
jgi:alcohol dehydrogenase class IV